jgi:site-specific DNA-cytosine methylase
MQVANSVTPGEGRHWEPSIETLIPDTSPALKARDFKGPSSDGTGDGAPLIPVIANTLRSGPSSEASHGKQSGTDRETLIPIVLDDQGGHAMSVSTDGNVGALRSESHQHQPVIAVRTAQTGANGEGVAEEVAHTLDGANGQAVCFDTTQVTSKTNRSNPKPGDPCHTLSKDADAPLVVQPIAIHPHVIGRSPTSGPQGKEYLDDGSAYTMDARGTPQSVVYDMRGNGDGNTCPTLSRSAAGDRPNDFAPVVLSNVSDTITSGCGKNKGVIEGGGNDLKNLVIQPQVFQSKASASQSMNPADVSPSLDVGKSEGMAVVAPSTGSTHAPTMQVRRLTPEECEKLMGMKPGYTLVPYRGKAAADGNRYKAIGNSIAVPCLVWLGKRIEYVEGILCSSAKNAK